MFQHWNLKGERVVCHKLSFNLNNFDNFDGFGTRQYTGLQKNSTPYHEVATNTSRRERNESNLMAVERPKSFYTFV